MMLTPHSQQLYQHRKLSNNFFSLANQVCICTLDSNIVVLFTLSWTHEGNSQIVYYANGNTSSNPVFGIVTFIYFEKTKPTIQPTAAVERLTLVGDGNSDPFSKYPHWPAQLYYCNSNIYEWVQPDWIHGHFARCNIDDTQMFVVPLNSVSCFLYLLSQSTHFFP